MPLSAGVLTVEMIDQHNHITQISKEVAQATYGAKYASEKSDAEKSRWCMMDWSELERKPKSNKQSEQIRIQPKKVAVRKYQIRKLPDGTTIVIPDKN